MPKRDEIGRIVVGRQVAEARALIAASGVDEAVALELILLGARMAGVNEGVCSVLGILVEPETDQPGGKGGGE